MQQMLKETNFEKPFPEKAVTFNCGFIFEILGELMQVRSDPL